MTPDPTPEPSGPAFYASLPSFDRFGEVGRAAHYRPLPDDWVIGITDVVESTQAIATGRYKDVNLAGAAAIGAVGNAIGNAPFPYVFGGDGATFALWPEAAGQASDALAQTRRWAAEELGLDLRVGLVPVRDVRAAGLRVDVARFQSAPDLAYAMFSGGGVAWATAELKAGRRSLPEAPAGARPDLTGLSCRFNPMPSRNGTILSIIVQPRPGVALEAVEPILERIIARANALARQGDPVPIDGPGFGWPPRGLDIEARTSRRGDAPLWPHLAKLGAMTLAFWILDRAGRALGPLAPLRGYRKSVARNADWRKYDDGLRLTIDCDADTRAAIERDLRDGAATGLIDYGVHAQDEALMTCLVPSVLRNDHAHFIDGADGGYARAAAMLKAQAASA